MAALIPEEEVIRIRARVRRVAERHMAQYGADAMSLRAIAAELDWTAASLYRYYKSKAALIDAVCEDAHNRFSDKIEAAYRSTDDLWDRSRAIGDAYVDFAEQEPAAYRLMFSCSRHGKSDKSEALKAAEQRSSNTLITYVQEMVDAGLMEGDAEFIAYSYWSAIHGLIMLKQAGLLEKSPSFNLLRHESVSLITRGARKKD